MTLKPLSSCRTVISLVGYRNGLCVILRYKHTQEDRKRGIGGSRLMYLCSEIQGAILSPHANGTSAASSLPTLPITFSSLTTLAQHSPLTMSHHTSMLVEWVRSCRCACLPGCSTHDIRLQLYRGSQFGSH